MGNRRPVGKKGSWAQIKTRDAILKNVLIQTFFLFYKRERERVNPKGQNEAPPMVSKSKVQTAGGLGPSEEEETHQGPHSVIRRVGNRKDRFETWWDR